MRTISDMLALWKVGQVSSEELVSWADRVIQQTDQPSCELIELSAYGPETCLRRPIDEFAVRPTELSYRQEFALRAVKLDGSDSALLSFAAWARTGWECEDFSDPIVKIGIWLDHYFDDPQGLLAMLRSELPALMDECKLIARRFEE